jgi:hypothetical protein
LPKAIVTALCAWAEAEPDNFIAFVATAKASDLMAIHHLLTLGLERIAAVRPVAVLDYLLEDPRRLALGTDSDAITDSVRLIAAVAPELSAGQALRLEQAILSWRNYREIPVEEDAKTRFRSRQWEREHRLVLLRAMPAERLSPQGQRHRREEERALPGTDLGTSRVSGGWIGSPMSAEQMAKASDQAIIHLFEQLTDATGSSHPNQQRYRNQHIGGSSQASQAFAAFAKAEPQRALRIIDAFQPGQQERPAGAAWHELAGVDSVAPAELIACCHDLVGRGFSSDEFRQQAAWGLAKLAERNGGLDERTCALLERWLSDWAPRPLRPHTLHAESTNTSIASRRSLLWDNSALKMLPSGNFPILRALYYGYLLRIPPAGDRILAILERHLERPEDPEVWQALANHLHHLGHADQARAATFLKSLFDRVPELLNTEDGTHLVAEIGDWCPADVTAAVVDGWLGGDWPQGPQAAGEVAAVRLCRAPDDAAARQRVEAFVDGTGCSAGVTAGLRLGLAYTLSRGWQETPLLLRLIPAADPALAKALLTIFHGTDPLPADDHTRVVLRALAQQRHILAANNTCLIVEALKGLLRDGLEPELVHAMISPLIDQAEQSGTPYRALAGIDGDLIELALTLHRLSDSRSLGLDLFERLMALQAPGLESHLKSLDRRPFR